MVELEKTVLIIRCEESFLKCALTDFRGFPLMYISPVTALELLTLSARMLRSVVFPHPDGPMIARVLPGGTRPFNSLRRAFGAPVGNAVIILMLQNWIKNYYKNALK